MNNDQPTRIGIIGLGHIGHDHADCLCDSTATLAGGMDIDSEARAEFANTYDMPVFEDADALFDAVDAVIVATPNRYHEQYAVAALEAGLDVLLEKPLAHSLASAERIAATAHEADGFCMVGFKNRFAAPVELLKQFQQEGRFGELHHIEANYIRRRGVPHRTSWFTQRPLAGGGALIDIGVHAIDLALYLLDFPPIVEVTGTTRSLDETPAAGTDHGSTATDGGTDTSNVEKSATAFIRCADGRTISLEVAWAITRSPDYTFAVQGTHAGACFDIDKRGLTLYEGDHTDEFPVVDTDITPEPNDRIAAEQATFLRGVESGAPPEQNTVEQALTVQRISEAIYRSAETGRAVSLAEGDTAERS
ncbi:Gfo/Idh/MocA family protein [Halococcus sp. AFM35]|uniref:Gfo/Idh/MocA family protein n=1 Tax=Halococcus sp. AFM35 TaxID=3421653 RepID=UPI003EB6E962